MNSSANIIICKDAKSPYYLAQFTDPLGKRVRRSTKVPTAGGRFGDETLTRAQAKRRALQIAFSIARAAEHEYHAHDNRSVREVCELMLSGKLGHVSQATYNNARTDYRQFCSWLGNKAEQPIRHITKADIRAWIIDRRKSVRCKTCRKALSAVNAAFRWAQDSEIIDKNPCTGIQIPPDSKEEKIIHEAFSPAEVTLLIEKLPDEWSAAVRCCIGTYGQRLGDILALRWEQFDWEERTVNIITGKTASILKQPMSDDFYSWARERYQNALLSQQSSPYVLPRLHSHSNPSTEFTQLVRLHGIGLTGQALSGNRRTWHSKTFHSLRAYVATQLCTAGVSMKLAMQLIGHESEQIHAVYIRPTLNELRAAAAKLPDLALHNPKKSPKYPSTTHPRTATITPATR